MFCTAINCMDGRAQLPVIEYLQNRFDVEFVDMITEPGPNRILAETEDGDEEQVKSILLRCGISINNHGSVGIAVVGHHDCAGNPSEKTTQKRQIKQAISFLKQRWDAVEIIGLWLDADFRVHELTF